MIYIKEYSKPCEVPGLVTFDGLTYYRKAVVGDVRYQDDRPGVGSDHVGFAYRLYNAHGSGPYIFDGGVKLGQWIGSPVAESLAGLSIELSDREDKALLAYALYGVGAY